MQSVTDQETYKSAQPLDNAALSALSAGISKATVRYIPFSIL